MVIEEGRFYVLHYYFKRFNIKYVNFTYSFKDFLEFLIKRRYLKEEFKEIHKEYEIQYSDEKEKIYSNIDF